MKEIQKEEIKIGDLVEYRRTWKREVEFLYDNWPNLKVHATIKEKFKIGVIVSSEIGDEFLTYDKINRYIRLEESENLEEII